MLKARTRLAMLQQQVAAGTFVNRQVILTKAKKAVGRTHDLRGVFSFALEDTPSGQPLQVQESVTALQDERDLQGVYLLRSTDSTLSADDLWRTYLLLTRVEAAFRHWKTDRSIRPLFHRKENRGDAHVLFSVLAYALAVTIPLRNRQQGGVLTTAALLETLQPLGLAELSYHTSDGHRLAFERAAVPSAAQLAILTVQRYFRPCRKQSVKTATDLAAQLRLAHPGASWGKVLLDNQPFDRPMDRRLEALRSHGLDLSHGGLTDGLKRLAPLIEPVYEARLAHNQRQHLWHADETRGFVLASTEGNVGYQWYLWFFQSAEAEDSAGFEQRDRDVRVAVDQRAQQAETAWAGAERPPRVGVCWRAWARTGGAGPCSWSIPKCRWTLTRRSAASGARSWVERTASGPPIFV